MALFTTNPQETVNVAEAVASRIPTAALASPLNGAVNVPADTDISISLPQGALTLPIVTVNGVIVFRQNQPEQGWSVLSQVPTGETVLLVLHPPVGFAYKSTVTVQVDFEVEAGINDEA